LPQVLIEVDDLRRRYALPWSAFPDSLRHDVKAMAQAAVSPDPLSTEVRRPLRQATVKGRMRACQALASALVHRGRAPETIRSISDLVRIDAAKDALRFFLDRNGQRRSAYLRDYARLLSTLAKHWVYARQPAVTREEEVARDMHLQGLDTLRRNLEPDRCGMTDKNRSTLRHFQDGQMVERLLGLPARIWRRHPRGQKLKVSDLIRLQVATAIDVLTVAPIRRKNLVEMQIDRNLVWVGPGKSRRLHLYFAAEDVKNETQIEFELPQATTEMLDRYLNEVRPQLLAGASPYLFAGKAQSYKSPYLLSRQIADLTAAEIGVRITAHQFRHIAGYLYLKSNPGGHEVVRRLLGHKSIETTIQFYAGMEATEAVRHYDSLISELRASSPSRRPTPKAGRKRRGS
jgi:integrase